MDELPPAIFKQDIGNKWMSEDTARQITYLLLHGADWAQTRTIAKNPELYGEKNPILGRQPSVNDVNKYFAATGLAHALLASQLSPEYRKWFQYGTIGLELGMVGRNKMKLGIGMTF